MFDSAPADSGRVREAYANHGGFRVRQSSDDRGAAFAHVFRFDGDHIAELWDFGPSVSPESVNANGMP